MSATWARLRLGRVYHRALSLALSTASTAPTEGPSTPKGHLADSTPFARASHVRTSCLDLHPSERLIPAHGTHAESWAYRGGHLSEGALASTDAPHEESGCALLIGLPPPRRKTGVTSSGIKLRSNKITEETQVHLTSGEEGLESNVNIKLLPTKITAVDSKVSSVVLENEPKSTDVNLPSIKTAEETQEQSLIPEDPTSDVLPLMETSEPVEVPLFSAQSDEVDSGYTKSAQLADKYIQLDETEHIIIAEFPSSSESLRLSSKDSGIHGTHSELLSKKSTLEASDLATQNLENTSSRQEYVILSNANSSYSSASVANVFNSESYESASFTPICELIVEMDSDSTISSSSSTRPDLNLASTNPGNGLDSKGDGRESTESETVVEISAGPGSEQSFLPPPPPPPPMPPIFTQ